MNLLERVFTLLRANLDSVVERSHDPERALRQLQLDMHNQLVQVKTEIARTIAVNHTLQKRSQAKKAEAEIWLKKAEQAVQQGHDDAAREALVQYNHINKQNQRYLQQKKEQEQIVTTMRNALHQLESKITEVETTVELLTAQKRTALIQQRVLEALKKTNNFQGLQQPQEVQEKILEEQARALARADLQKRDVEQQLEQLSTTRDIEQQLKHIKDKRHTSPEATRLSEKKVQTSPLEPLQNESLRKREKSFRQTSASDEPSTERDLDLDYLKKLLDTPQSTDY